MNIRDEENKAKREVRPIEGLQSPRHGVLGQRYMAVKPTTKDLADGLIAKARADAERGKVRIVNYPLANVVSMFAIENRVIDALASRAKGPVTKEQQLMRREAFFDGLTALGAIRPRGSEGWRAEAIRRFPLPLVDTPRVVTAVDTLGGTIQYRMVEGAIQYRYPDSPGSVFHSIMSPAEVEAVQGLLKNPTQLLPDPDDATS